MNMFKAVKATSIQEYFDMLSDDRRDQLLALHKFIQEKASTLKPNFSYNMPGYGSFKYTNYKKEVIDWPIIAIASQKNYISIYICATDNGQYLAEKYSDVLGKVTVGKSCIRFKKIEDLNLKTLEKIIKIAVKKPGLVSKNMKH